MDCTKTGMLIRKLRKSKYLTQKDIADALNISNKTISKWECGLGFPDASLWAELSSVLNVDIAQLLEGEMPEKSPDSGNMKKLKFYVCEKCNNIVISTSSASVFCCGRKLNELNTVNQTIDIKAEVIDYEYFITVNHPMTKENYILFAAMVKNDTVLLKRLYPEQNPEMRFPFYKGAKLYICNNKYELIYAEYV